jgi:hypothetical protein
MGRRPCCDKVGLKRGTWSVEEDQKLMNFILSNGIKCWRHVPKLAGTYVKGHDSLVFLTFTIIEINTTRKYISRLAEVREEL